MGQGKKEKQEAVRRNHSRILTDAAVSWVVWKLRRDSVPLPLLAPASSSLEGTLLAYAQNEVAPLGGGLVKLTLRGADTYLS